MADHPAPGGGGAAAAHGTGRRAAASRLGRKGRVRATAKWARRRVRKEAAKRATQAATGGWLTPRRIMLLAAVAAALLVGLVVVLAMAATSAADAARQLPVVGSLFGSDPLDAGAGATGAAGDIPPDFLALYHEAADARQLDWAILAGIGKVECDHGRSTLAGCNPRGTVNRAGARGPMQFLGSTWRRGAGQHDPEVAGAPVPEGREGDGYATDGNGDGLADPWQPDDAIHAAARLVGRNGAPGDYTAALRAYNDSGEYVEDVLRWAQSYRQETAAGPAADGSVDLATVRGITVARSIAPNVDALVVAAQRDGHTLTGSGHRSHERQIELRQEHCGRSDYAIYEMPSGQCTPPTARPGSSMHEVGLAVDFSCDGALIESRSSACFTWMEAHAPPLGLYNLPSEPWHWSIDGS